MAALPIGTVTFLFTDIEGHSRLWEQHPAAMSRALAHHDALVSALVARDGCQAVAESVPAELRLVGALRWFWPKTGYLGEARQRVEAALSRSASAPLSLRTRARMTAWGVSYFQGDFAAARSFGAE